jgi:hypothetical protein
MSKGFRVNFFPLDKGAPPIGGTYVLLSSTGSSFGYYYCFFPMLLSSASINSLISAPLFEAPPPN